MSNGMALVRADPRARERLHAAIAPFIPQQQRDMMSAIHFLRAAEHHLEGKDFRPETIFPALITFAMAGLLPNRTTGHGYLIPYKRVVTPIFGYKGLLELAARARPPSGQVLLDVRTDCVLDGDQWDVAQGYERAAETHRKQRDRDPRKGLDKLLGAYAAFRFAIPMAGKIHEYCIVEWMEPGEILAARAASASGSTGPWSTYPLRMATKTVIRRACTSGRVPLGYYAGSAMLAQSQAEAGDWRGYLKTMRDASDQNDACGAIFDEADGVIDADVVEEHDPVKLYEAASAPIKRLLEDPTCTLERAVAYMRQISSLLTEHGLKRDERADALYRQIQRESSDG